MVHTAPFSNLKYCKHVSKDCLVHHRAPAIVIHAIIHPVVGALSYLILSYFILLPSLVNLIIVSNCLSQETRWK